MGVFLHDAVNTIKQLRTNDSTCVKTVYINDANFYRYILIPAALLIVALILLKQWLTRKETGAYQKMVTIWPVDLISQRNHRIPYVAAFCISAWSVYTVLTEDSPLKLETTIAPLRSLLTLVTCILLAFIFYPIFAAISSRHWIGFGIGAIYTWSLTIVYLLSNMPCYNDPASDIVFTILRFIPCFMWMLYLCGYFPFRIITSFTGRSKKHLKTYKKKRFEYDYVRRLISSPKLTPEPYIESYGPKGSVVEKITKAIFKYVYAPIAGYRYPVSMLASGSVSALLVWMIGLQILEVYENLSIVGKVMILDAFKETVINNLAVVKNEVIGNDTGETTPVDDEQQNTTATDPPASGPSALVVALKMYNAVLYSMYISFALAVLNNLLSNLLTMRNYRKNILSVYKGKVTHIPHWKNNSPSDLVVSGSKYVGYQFAYSLWGFLLQSITLFLVCTSISCAIVYATTYDWGIFRTVLYTIGPPLAYVYGLMIIQRLVVHFLFLRKNDEGKRILAIKRFLGFLNFQYFMVFINSAVGFLSCLLRIIKALVFGISTMQRLDVSNLSRTFEVFDNGFTAYVALLAVEHVQTNPIMLTFLSVIKEDAFKKRFQKVFESRNSANHASLWGEIGLAAKTGTSMATKRKLVLRNRWWLAYTLINNPYLKFYRIRSPPNTREAVDSYAAADEMAKLEMILMSARKAKSNLEKIGDV